MGIKDVDAHKLMYYPKEVAEWLTTGATTPLHVEIGPTNRCNHHCSFCSVDWATHGKVLIDTDVLVKAIHSMADVGVRSIYFAGEGEPMLHPDIGKFLQAGWNRGIKTSMATNGSRLTEKMIPEVIPYLSWVRFSIDAARPDTHKAIHKNKDFTRVIKHLRAAAAYKKEHNLEVELGAQFIVLEENLNELEEFADLMKDVGVDNVQFKPHHNHPKSASNPTLYNLTDEALKQRLIARSTDDFVVMVRSRNIQELPTIQGQSHNYCYKKCYAYNFLTLIDAYGECYGCNVFYNTPDYSFGNIYKQSFEEIHTSGQVQDTMERVAELEHVQCGNYKCRPHVLNEYLQRVKHPERNDEFI